MSRGNHFSRLRPLSFMYFIYKAMQICFIGGQLVSKNVNGVTLEFDDLRKTHTAPKNVNCSRSASWRSRSIATLSRASLLWHLSSTLTRRKEEKL